MSRIKIVLLVLSGIILIGYTLPQDLRIPVKGATNQDWNHNTFWHYPWGKSVVHKGIDIFAPETTPVIASVYGLVIYSGTLGIGGNSVAILGPNWRIHYYAHMKEIKTGFGSVVKTGEQIGTVGRTGNATTRPPHLHYSIFTPIPYIWRWDSNRLQGWKKIFVLDPTEMLLNTE